LALAGPAAAQPSATSTWTGTAGAAWSAAANWSPSGAPAGGPDTVLGFGATTTAVMTNDLTGLAVNAVVVAGGSPAYSLSGNPIALENNSGGVGPQIVSNSANGLAIADTLSLANGLTVSGGGNMTLSGSVTGPGGLTMSGTGTLTLGGSNSYSGLTVQNGTVSVGADAALGAAGASVTGAGPGTLSFTGTTGTARSLFMNNGTITVSGGQTVTFNGGTVAGATLDGTGTFAANGSIVTAVTSQPSVAVTSTTAGDRFVHFVNGGSFTVAGGVNTAGTSTVVNFNGFTNQGSGTVTVGQDSQINVANFQSYGTLTLNPGTFNGTTGNVTQMTNLGSSALFFNGGSRTFISTVAQAANGNAGMDLHGNDAIVAGGLFVNNGFVFDSVGAGTHRVVADFGAVVKGAGFYQPLPRTINGGTFSAGNSPGRATTGTIVLGGPNDPNGGLSDFTWQINDAGPSTTYPTATGASGPTANAAKQVSGWGQLAAVAVASPVATNGDFHWDATPADKMTIHLQTLVAPNDASGTPVSGGGYGAAGDNTAGLMSDFDPTQSYLWKLFSYEGAYTGPTDTASLNASAAIDASGFLNPHAGRFDLVLNTASREMDLTFTPTAVPEPGTLTLMGLAGLGLGWRLRRRAA
jgi:hypothetical protein